MSTARIPKFRTDELTVQEMLWAEEVKNGSLRAGVDLLAARLDPADSLKREHLLNVPLSVFTAMCNEMARCFPKPEEDSQDAWKRALDMLGDDEEVEGEDSE